MTYVDVDPDARVAGRVDSWERDKRSWCAAASTGDCDLRTRDVKLSAVGLARTMQGDVLNPQEIVTRWSVLGNGDADRVLIFYLLALAKSP